MKRSVCAGISLLMTAALALPALAQSEAENNAYRIFYNEKDPKKKIEAGEKFLTDFKESTYRSPILQTILGAYVQAQNWAKVIEHGDKLQTELPNADAKTRTALYTFAMAAAQSSNNAAKTIDFGEKVLAADPNNLNAQLLVSTTIPQTMPQDKAANDKALALAAKALGGVDQYFSQAKPANLTDAQWKAARAEYDEQLHSAIGLIHFTRADFVKAIEEYQAVIKSNQKDAVARFYLGLAYRNQAAEASKAVLAAIQAFDAARTARAPQPEIDELDAKRQGLQAEFQDKRDKALDELASAVAIGGAVTQQARTALDSLYSTKNNSLDGIDQFIQEKKQQLQ